MEVSSSRPKKLAARVGGGYSRRSRAGEYAYKWNEEQELQPPKLPEEGLAICEKTITIPNVTCLAVVQGGATMWTGEDDGSITIRNGLTGKVQHRVKRSSASQVVKMLAVDTLLWAGTNDGGIEVYEQVDAVKIFQSKEHRGSVHFLVEKSNGDVLSAEAAGLICHWAFIDDRLTMVQQIKIPVCISALEVAGEAVFVGDTTGNVTFVQANPFAINEKWEAHLCTTVTAILFHKGLVYTGGSDGVIRVWANTSTGTSNIFKIDDLHAGPIRRFLVERGSQIVWSFDDVFIRRWACQPECLEAPFVMLDDPKTVFSHVKEDDDTVSIIDSSMIPAWEALRVWSLSSKGTNMLWYSMYCRAEEEMRRALDDTAVMVEQNRLEATKWTDAFEKFKGMDAGQKQKFAHAMASATAKGMAAIAFSRWRRWLSRVGEVRRRAEVAQCLMRGNTTGLLRLYWGKLEKLRDSRRRVRRKLLAVDRVMCLSSTGLRRVYWAKINAYRVMRRKEDHRDATVGALRRNTELGLLAVYYHKLRRLREAKRVIGKKLQMAHRLLTVTTRGHLLLYYKKLEGWRRLAARRRRHKLQGELLGGGISKGLLRIYYGKLLRWAEQTRRLRRRRNASVVLLGNDRGKLLVYFHMWKRFHNERTKCKDKLTKNDALRKRIHQLEAEQERSKFPEANAKLRAAKDRAASLEARYAATRNRISALEKANEVLRRRIAIDEITGATLKEQLLDIMSKLKEMALNFDSDRNLICKTVDKAKSTTPVRLFLEAHMQVKAVVVCTSKKSNLRKDDLWPMEKVLGKIQPFELRKVYVAIKEMVIAFDLMDLTALHQLETDDEIVLNGKNLIDLFKKADEAARKS